MSNANLYTLFREQFPADPAAVFLDGVDGRVLRYGEAGQRSGKVLSVLQRHGVTQGDRVVVEPAQPPADHGVDRLGVGGLERELA